VVYEAAVRSLAVEPGTASIAAEVLVQVGLAVERVAADLVLFVYFPSHAPASFEPFFLIFLRHVLLFSTRQGTEA
jgi:hypothetical protein